MPDCDSPSEGIRLTLFRTRVSVLLIVSVTVQSSNLLSKADGNKLCFAAEDRTWPRCGVTGHEVSIASMSINSPESSLSWLARIFSGRRSSFFSGDCPLDISLLFRFFGILRGGSALIAAASVHNIFGSPQNSSVLLEPLAPSSMSSPVKSIASAFPRGSMSRGGSGVCLGVCGACTFRTLLETRRSGAA